MDLLAVEIHGDHRFFGELALLETSGAKNNIVGVPFAQAVECLIGRLRFIDHRPHAMLGFVALANLYLVTVLEIHAAVAARVHHQEFDVQPKIAIGLFRHNVRRAVLSAVRGPIIRHEHRPFVHRVFDDLPLDRQRGGKAWPLPISPLLIEQLARTINDDFCAGNGLGADADVFVRRKGWRGESYQ